MAPRTASTTRSGVGRAQARARSRGRARAMALENAPMRSRRALAGASARRAARSASASAVGDARRRARAAIAPGVREGQRRPARGRAAARPTSRSSAATCWETAGWVSASARAAARERALVGDGAERQQPPRVHSAQLIAWPKPLFELNGVRRPRLVMIDIVLPNAQLAAPIDARTAAPAQETPREPRRRRRRPAGAVVAACGGSRRRGTS